LTSPARKRITPLDIPIGELERIEAWAGVRVEDWPDGVPSLAGLFGRLYAAANGLDYATVSTTMTFRQLAAEVGLGDDDDGEGSAPAEGDPTPAGP
jgi:hypothetical protein